MTQSQTDTPPRPLILELLAFVVVGGLGAVGYAVLSVALISLRSGVPDWLMGGIAYAAMILPVYLGHRAFSFPGSGPHSVALPRYVAVQAMGIALASAFSYVAYNLFGIAGMLGALFVAAATAAVSFVFLRLWAFAGR